MTRGARGYTRRMRAAAALLAAVLAAGSAQAQTTKRPSATRRPTPPAPPVLKKEPATVACPAALGPGVKTGRTFCDVLATRDPAEGIAVTIPPHDGEATLSFDLHNRHTYSEQQVRAGRAFAEYTATILVVGPDNQILARAAVTSAFRSAADLVDRVGGGAGPGGVKAVAPIGTEPITVVVPAAASEVRLLGERLTVHGFDGRSVFTATGRPVAIVSNVEVEYRPSRAKRPPARKPTTKPRTSGR